MSSSPKRARTRTMPGALSLAAALVLGMPMTSLAESPPLIPREVLFGNPERIGPKLSPDGTRMAWIAPDKKNILQVWVKTIGKEDDRIVTADPKRGIRQFSWAENSRVLLYMQDSDGDENFHVYGVDLASGSVRDLTPFQGAKAQITATDPGYPDTVLVSLNVRSRALFDVYRLDLNTGGLTVDTENPGDVMGWVADSHLQVRAAQAMTPTGGAAIRVRDDASSAFRPWLEVGPEDALTFGALDFSADGRSLTLLSSVGRDTAAVVQRDIAAGTETVLAASDEADADSVLIHPKTHAVQAARFSPGRSTWKVIDPSIAEDFEAIGKLREGDFSVVNRDNADRTWLVAFASDRGPVAYYAWDRSSRKGTFLFVHQPKLEGLALAEMKPVKIKARDGLTLNAYLTLPVGIEPRGLPMVLMVHGGPWARDQWGYNPYAQWFANRGYACLSVNFRGSTGYGKAFLNAANKQWGKAMHDDLIDACKWASDRGFADPKKIAVFGGSYGGYAALAALTFTPEFFACAVDMVGPSNLKTLIATIPPYWKPMRVMFDTRMGNVDDPKDAELIREASPLFKADRIRRPLLIGQGANDPRVKQAESEQIVAAIEKNGGRVTYVLYPDEGHGFARPENRIDFNARAEAFLAECLGGRVEPMAGDKVAGSTAVVKEVGRK
ncbi:Prolyl tripeptidyl peptidase precursor [Aquisphaera giovannonii]|uniref:Prolyl tripeptidyl peptidase n=1 Tax=Aquisphaera giovannonii TaxID=406548 RepID=A0A5B9W1H4_9BACT|nr:S9 family peptidase [Aquisphaera giovannonii]QEH33855.1 Prolyl tripeptidyl peptidase precursor [Aquisphaera giovannonii]